MGQLTCLRAAGRQLVAQQLTGAAAREGRDWTARFAVRIFSFALWSGLVFAAVIGFVTWSARIASLHAAAATTAAAYLLIAAVAIPVCRDQAHEITRHLNRVSAAAVRNFLAWYLPVLSAAGVLYIVINLKYFRLISADSVLWFFYVNELAHFIAVTALGCVVAYPALAFAYARALPAPPGNDIAAWVITLGTGGLPWWLPGTHDNPAPAGNSRLDSGLLQLLDCTVTLDEMSRGDALPGAGAVKSLIAGIELAAAVIERYSVSRVPRMDTATRRLAVQDGLRLASVIRSTKAPVAGAIKPGDYRVAAASLADFLLAWAQSGDGRIMTVLGDNMRVERTPPWRRITGRVWNAVLLAAGGAFLPFLPIYNGDPAAAAALRYALVTAAVLALAAPGSSASDIIQRNIERVGPGGAVG